MFYIYPETHQHGSENRRSVCALSSPIKKTRFKFYSLSIARMTRILTKISKFLIAEHPFSNHPNQEQLVPKDNKDITSDLSALTRKCSPCIGKQVPAHFHTNDSIPRVAYDQRSIDLLPSLSRERGRRRELTNGHTEGCGWMSSL